MTPEQQAIADAHHARHALEDDELGLDGLVPVDRILATVGGMLGGALTVLALVAWWRR